MDTLKLGSKGEDVKVLQKALQTFTEDTIVIDGDFGPTTHKHVVSFQKARGLVADGLVGKRTQIALGTEKFTQVPKYALTEKDLMDAAEELGCTVKHIKAVSEVESAGSGFSISNGVAAAKGTPIPDILYERHLFYRSMVNAGMDILAEMASTRYPSICNKNTGGYIGGEQEHRRLLTAKRIHPEFAMESCSWGRYQILGRHWEALGYRSIEDYVFKMNKNEGEHLKAFVKFIKNDKRLHTALKEGDWTTFARIYNGPAYDKHPVPYDVQMLRAFKRLNA